MKRNSAGMIKKEASHAIVEEVELNRENLKRSVLWLMKSKALERLNKA